MAECKCKSHIFGPVPSRRLGRSLGVDIMPFKVCSYDCIYCQLGRTTIKTSERKEYIPKGDIIADLDMKLEAGCEFDYITISGSGEPTLNSGIGEIISAVRERSKKPLAVLTNGSLLWNSEVRDAISGADLVIPSLDAGCQEVFETVNRPCPELKFEKMVEGLEQFSREFCGKIWLEVFILGGIMDPYANLKGIPDLAKRISPTAVQLNTIARPPCEKYAQSVSRDVLEEIAKLFTPNAEIIADFREPDKISGKSVGRADILNLLARRPCACSDISGSLDAHYIEIMKELTLLVEDGAVITVEDGDRIFYKSIKQEDDIK